MELPGPALFATHTVSPSPSTGLGSEIDSALADVLVNRAAHCLLDGRGLFTNAGPLLLAVNPQPSPAAATSSPSPAPGGPLSAASVFHGNVLWRYYAEAERAAGADAFGSSPTGRARGRAVPPRPSAAAALPPHGFVRGLLCARVGVWGGGGGGGGQSPASRAHRVRIFLADLCMVYGTEITVPCDQTQLWHTTNASMPCGRNMPGR